MKSTLLRKLSLGLLMSILSLTAFAGEAGRLVLVSGKVSVQGGEAKLNAVLPEGVRIQTGADGYAYIKTVDNGFLIIRPNSDARIVQYVYDAAKPEDTKVKIELLSGVARSVSGDGVKHARQNFRFNTPVAAIGVRGTDFTVHTTQDVSRISVMSGGVVASSFSNSCLASGVGPCEGMNAVELFARQQGHLLQISKNQAKPDLLNAKDAKTVSPDAVTPARNDETNIVAKPPAVQTTPNSNNNTDLTAVKVNNAISQVNGKPNAPENTIIWGRWREVLGAQAQVDLSTQNDHQIIGINSAYIIFRAKNSEWQTPSNGSMGFALKGGDAFVFNEAMDATQKAGIENGKLNLDFAAATFKTSFDLVSDKERWNLQSQGLLTKDGLLYGDSQFKRPTNMDVSGVVTGEKGGSASYIFNTRLDNNRIANGITYWGR